MKMIIAAFSFFIAVSAFGRVLPVVITWSEDPQTTATLAWEREETGRGCVEYGLTTNYTHTLYDGGGTYRHCFVLRGLEPNTRYHYRVSSSDGYRCGDHTFMTAPTPTGSLHFVVHGDLQGGIVNSAARDVAEAINEDAPDLVIHVGDVANVDYDEHPFASWIDFFNATTDELERVVFMPTAGNHDDAPNNNSEYWKIFHLPERPSNGSYYSFDVANIHFTALNTDLDIEGQTNWLMRDLQQAAGNTNIDWIVPYFHRPPYSLGERAGDEEVKTNLCPAFVMYEADVAFSGHSHNYQRWIPIRGVNYFVVGGGGGRLYTSDFTPGAHEFATTCYHFVSGNVTGNVMTLKAIRSDGLLFDQVTYTNRPRFVRSDPALPVRGDTVTISYNADDGPLFYSDPVYIHLGLDEFSSAVVDAAMTYNPGNGRWEYAYTVPTTCMTRLAFVFHDDDTTNWHNNYDYNWQILLDRFKGEPATPAADATYTLHYDADMGPLAGGGTLNAFIQYNRLPRWTPVTMTNTSGGHWTTAVTLPPWADSIDIMFGNTTGVDDNYGMYWHQTITGASAPPPPIQPPPVINGGSPLISSNPPVIQNIVGDNFDLNRDGGATPSSYTMYGFGDFGAVYFNHDTSNLYLGGIQSDLGGTNNVMVLFLGLNTLSDNATNLWHKSSAPQALDYLHNVSFTEPMDLAIVFGDEYGDQADYPHFTYPTSNHYDFGQGIYYIGTNSSAFIPVPGAMLSQFDGVDDQPVTTTDDDGNRQTDRWEASLPWTALGASGIDSIDGLAVAGVIASDSTNGADRYLSASVVAQRVYGSRHTWGNVGYNVMTLAPLRILRESDDVDFDGLPNYWELRYFGTPEGPPPDDDDDGDRMDNRDEYIADTNPTNPASFFSMGGGLSTTPFDGGFVVTWPATSNRWYDLHRSTNQLETFIPIATNLVTGCYTDTVNNIDHATYRVNVRLQP
ncbi:MAG: hypothetical protein EOM20_10995 [Spartobacteria bacterium]|nr:hypothetical protein [Spartobacteria bacterium]